MQKANLKQFKKFNAKNFKVGIVMSQFNIDVTEKLLTATKKMLASYQVPAKNVTVFRVAGCVEAPVVLKVLAETGSYSCLVALGAIIRGDTAHFDYVAKIVSEGVLRVMLDYGIPVGFGVLTLENKEQADHRYKVGAWAAEAALQSAHLIKSLL